MNKVTNASLLAEARGIPADGKIRETKSGFLAVHFPGDSLRVETVQVKLGRNSIRSICKNGEWSRADNVPWCPWYDSRYQE